MKYKVYNYTQNYKNVQYTSTIAEISIGKTNG